MEWWVWAILASFIFLLARGWVASRRKAQQDLEAVRRNSAQALSYAKQEYDKVVRLFEAGELSSQDLERHMQSIFSYISGVQLGIRRRGVDDGSGKAAMRQIHEMVGKVGNMMMQREHEEWFARETQAQSLGPERYLM